jgi:hypothetical protein
VASRRNPRPCACGGTYAEFRLGMTFAEVRRMMMDQEDPNRPGWWRQKRRRSVLGYWRELKLHAWDVLHGYCEMEAAA